MLSGAIKESRLARDRRGLVLIQEGEGGDKGRDSSLYLRWELEVEEGWSMEHGPWRNKAGRVIREHLDWGGLVASGEGMFSPSKSGWKKEGMV